MILLADFTPAQIDEIIKRAVEATKNSGNDLLLPIGAAIISALTTAVVALFVDNRKSKAAHISDKNRHIQDLKDIIEKDIESRNGLKNVVENNTKTIEQLPDRMHDKITLAIQDKKNDR